MKILQIHNSYQQWGGEDAVVSSEQALLQAYGHTTDLLTVSNDNIKGLAHRLSTALQAPYSMEGFRLVRDQLARSTPSCVHCHNLFPLLTPSVYDACIEAGVAIVQTLHNYRLICPGALFMHSGRICEACLNGTPYQAVSKRCYRGSSLGSLAVARMVAFHRKHGTWNTKVDRFIALTRFAKDKFIEAGFPENKIAVKPNFYSGKGIPNNYDGVESRRGALFVGRVSREKGIDTLLRAWSALDLPLTIAGDGPLLDTARRENKANIKCLGRVGGSDISVEMAKAAVLVIPSEWYEGFPMVIVEAFAHGLPVVASDLGAMAEVVEDGVTGLLFTPGNADELAGKLRYLQQRPEHCSEMGYNARRIFEAKYTPDQNYQKLASIYQEAIAERNRCLK